jgi:signal transduction histidine kinase
VHDRSDDLAELDVDELHQRLRDHYTEIARMVGALAHEIKNPLSTIRLNLELLAEDLAEAATPRDRRSLAKVKVVERECQRLQNLLDDFLKFTRVRRLNFEPVDLNAQVERVIEFYRPQAEQDGIEIIWYPELDLPRVLLDTEAFQGALLNLVLNAQQAMPEGGQLMLRTHLTKNGVALDLVDTGSGMDEETRGRIFEPFYSTKSGGSGLGLPIARKIIEGHGGSIYVLSEPDRGTKFTIELPVLPRIGESQA